MFNSIKDKIRRCPKFHSILRMLRGDKLIFFDYPAEPKPRYGYGRPPHQILYEIINKNRLLYKKILNDFLQFEPNFLDISLQPHSARPVEPSWINDFLPILDAVSIYGFIALHKPSKYMEVGAGNSTKFARRAIKDHNLETSITSIDPSPKADIRNVCDKHMALPLEHVELREFDNLGQDDILFVDGSHRSFMNSDVTVFFLDIVQRLKTGVLVGIHDICLPYDYPPALMYHYYSEQYLLASYLLGGGKRMEITLPTYFISQDEDLFNILKPLNSNLQIPDNKDTHGCSFWYRVT